MAKFICSKLSNDQKYTTWNRGSKHQLPKADKSVLIKGGSGVVQKGQLITPYGVVTEISDAQYELLKNVPSFVRHEKNGFIKVLDKEPKPADTKAATDDLNADKSKPLTDKDIKDKDTKDQETGEKKKGFFGK